MKQDGFDPWSLESAKGILETYHTDEGALLEVLVHLQGTFGYIDHEAVELLADHFNVSQAEVYGVVTFYKDLRTQPSASHTFRICRGESCQAVGASDLVTAAQEIFGAKLEARGDEAIALEQVFCLGNCALSPAAMVDGDLIGRLSVAKIEQIAEKVMGGHR